MIDTQKFKVQLEAMRANLTSELNVIGIHDPENPSDWVAIPEGVDPNEADSDLVADVVEEWDERRALVATLERQYNDIARALAKIEQGTYGICEISGQPIEEDRLIANPAARTCKEHMNDEGALPQ
jgi:RNA polymerase-binding transcription factor DksA